MHTIIIHITLAKVVRIINGIQLATAINSEEDWVDQEFLT